MSFYNDKPWVKVPTTLFIDQRMRSVCARMPPDARMVPLSLYVYGETIADADGIFDIGDRTLAAATIHCEVSCVGQALRLMTTERLIAHVPDSTLFLFSEWDYPTRQTPVPLEERFALARIQFLEKQKSERFFCADDNSTSDGNYNFTVRSADIGKNTIQGEKNGAPQNREEEMRQEKSREDYISEEKKKDEIRQTRESETRATAPPPYEAPPASPGGGERRGTESGQGETKREKTGEVPPSSGNGGLVIYSVSSGNSGETKGEGEKPPERLLKKLGEAFSALNPGFSEEKGRNALCELASRIESTFGGDEDTLSKVAAVLVDALSRRGDAPVLPRYLLKDAVWNGIVSECSEKILLLYADEASERARLEGRFAWLREKKEAADFSAFGRLNALTG